jgi:hypothetical protein
LLLCFEKKAIINHLSQRESIPLLSLPSKCVVVEEKGVEGVTLNEVNACYFLIDFKASRIARGSEISTLSGMWDVGKSETMFSFWKPTFCSKLKYCFVNFCHCYDSYFGQIGSSDGHCGVSKTHIFNGKCFKTYCSRVTILRGFCLPLQ